jgi:chromosome segregation ATPase
MGVAAYQRGTMLIRSQHDAAPARHWQADAVANHVEPLRERIATLERDMERARRLIGLLRAEKQVAADRLAEARADAATWKATAGRIRETLSRVTRSWRKASALLRLLPPATVNHLRRERDES